MEWLFYINYSIRQGGVSAAIPSQPNAGARRPGGDDRFVWPAEPSGCGNHKIKILPKRTGWRRPQSCQSLLRRCAKIRPLMLNCCAASNREARVVMIASGGETAAMLATLPIAELQLVDVNQSQLNLTRLKLQLLTSAERGERLRLLGHLPMDADKRSGELARRLAELQLPADALGTPALVARHGPDHCGRYEWLFARMRECLLDQSDSVRQLMMLSEVDAQAAMIAPDTALARHLKAAYDHVMDLSRLAADFWPRCDRQPAAIVRGPFFCADMPDTSVGAGRGQPVSSSNLSGRVSRPLLALAGTAGCRIDRPAAVCARRHGPGAGVAGRGFPRSGSSVQYSGLDQAARGRPNAQ